MGVLKMTDWSVINKMKTDTAQGDCRNE
jgi:hypothetical protein